MNTTALRIALAQAAQHRLLAAAPSTSLLRQRLAMVSAP
jgi:hypothetical protein